MIKVLEQDDMTTREVLYTAALFAMGMLTLFEFAMPFNLITWPILFGMFITLRSWPEENFPGDPTYIRKCFQRGNIVTILCAAMVIISIQQGIALNKLLIPLAIAGLFLLLGIFVFVLSRPKWLYPKPY